MACKPSVKPVSAAGAPSLHCCAAKMLKNIGIHVSCPISLDVSVQESSVEVIPDCVIDKSLPHLRLSPLLVSENHIIIPPPLHLDSTDITLDSGHRGLHEVGQLEINYQLQIVNTQ